MGSLWFFFAPSSHPGKKDEIQLSYEYHNVSCQHFPNDSDNSLNLTFCPFWTNKEHFTYGGFPSPTPEKKTQGVAIISETITDVHCAVSFSLISTADMLWFMIKTFRRLLIIIHEKRTVNFTSISWTLNSRGQQPVMVNLPKKKKSVTISTKLLSSFACHL